jgi:hypothetical protein
MVQPPFRAILAAPDRRLADRFAEFIPTAGPLELEEGVLPKSVPWKVAC